MKFGLNESVIDKINRVFKKFPSVEEAIIYGSRAKGNFRNGSDIDLTLKGNDLGFATLQKINLELDDLFLPYTIDLSVFSKIENPDLIDHINRIGITFYNRDTDLIHNS